MLEFRPMGPVTAQTLYRQVLVPFIYDLVADRMGRVFRIVVTLCAKLDGRRLREQQLIVGSVGRMADNALPLFYRFMLCYRIFLALDRIRMACPAEPDRRRFQERPLCRRMRIVTIEAAVLPHDRQMEAVFGEHFVDHLVVASPAQFKPLFLQGERFGRRRAFMAQTARLIGKGRMGRIIDHSSLVGTVHAVTLGAAAIADGIILVLFDEDGFIDLVAAFAERRHLVGKESRGLRGPVRVVAVDAPFLHRVVLEFDLCNRVHLVFMAAIAQLVAALEQIVLIVRGVRIVALYALAFHSDLVRAACFLRQYPGMARKADPAHLGRQLFRIFRGVRAVTSRASRFYRRVNERFFQLSLEVRVARQADLLPGIRFQPEFTLSTFFTDLLRFCRLGCFRRLLCRFRIRLRRKTEAHYRKNRDNPFRS